ncbi:TRNA pseudouridine synthase [Actinidia chinensis var. chinensis]|uniref:tRNA pseudouridine synthase n=1 Tax=Actinidia chinensis var. chinensis TaxID=1590841 RepID=A0A2R6RGK9_ACTCC|nr:TRNA pseudouridine synthase [Actinidia chinensis var. chinensis]
MTDEKPAPLILESSNHALNRRPGSPQRPPKIPRIAGKYDDDDGEVEEEIRDETMNRNPRLQRYLVAIEYIGTRFAGAQQQPNCRTVVGVLADAFHKFIGQPVSIFCSSRTDAGVHALSNVCHVDVERISKRRPGEVLPPHEPAVVRRAVNHFLQKNEGDIMVIDVRCVAPDFHARFKAQERTYFYRLLSGPEPLSTFERDRAWHVPEELDILAMQKACRVLVGHHDFSSFRAASCQAKSPIRTLDELSVTEVVSAPYFPSLLEREQSSFMGEDPFTCPNQSKTDLPHNSLISSQDKVKSSNEESIFGFGTRRRHRCYVVTARARSFLYHQVRLLVGVIKSAGTEEVTISDVEHILNAKSVTAACPMAPACGLYLGNVKYDLP